MDASLHGTLYSNNGNASRTNNEPQERIYYGSDKAAASAASKGSGSDTGIMMNNRRAYGWKGETVSGDGLWNRHEG